jgi:uncharacterized protein YjbI with pentapeptide repeats
MTREEALEKFRTIEASEIFKETNHKCRKELLEKRDLIADRMRGAFWSALEQLTDHPEFNVQEVQFSYLQVHVMDGTYKWLVELHDENGDFVEQDISETVEMKEFFTAYESCRNELYQKAAQYVNALTPADCDGIMVENFVNVVPYLYLIGVYAFRGISEEPRFQEIPVHKIFRVLVGGRRDKAFLVYYKLENPEDGNTTLAKLLEEPKEKDYLNDEFMLFDLSNQDFQECSLTFRNFNLTIFRHASFRRVEMFVSKCMLGDWNDVTISDCVMEGDCFNGVDFSSSRIRNVSFVQSRFDINPEMDDMPMNPTMLPTKFCDAELKNVDFRGCWLGGCDFRGATLEEILFDEADLTNTIIASKYRDVLKLSEAQKKVVCWVDE